MKISKRTREQAALICAVAASTPWTVTTCAAFHLGVGAQAEPLAAAAWMQARLAAESLGESWSYAEVTAEAEALLRTGWTP